MVFWDTLINMNRLYIAKTIANLEQYAEKLNEVIPTINCNNDLSNRISSYIYIYIYEACKSSYIKPERREDIPAQDNLRNCTSADFQTIADANIMTYNTYSNNGVPQADIQRYIEDWWKYEKLAKQARNDELNCKINKPWKDKKEDGKKLWECIDWKGKAEIQPEK